MKTWLWLEDQPNTVEGIKTYFSKFNWEIRPFHTPAELINFLIGIKKKSPNDLKDMRLILDVLLPAQPILTCPSDWCGGKEPLFIQTEQGYDAGFVFFEKIIMYENAWVPPPPVIFLTVMPVTDPVIEQRLNNLRLKWSNAHGVSPEAAHIEWLRKWDADEKSLERLLKSWGEI